VARDILAIQDCQDAHSPRFAVYSCNRSLIAAENASGVINYDSAQSVMIVAN
jgi:hypothetical protein